MGQLGCLRSRDTCSPPADDGVPEWRPRGCSGVLPGTVVHGENLPGSIDELVAKDARWAALSEVFGAHFHEHGRRSDDGATVRSSRAGGDEQLAPVASGHVSPEAVRRSDQYRRQIIDRQLAGDGRASFDEEQATVKVIDNGGDRAAMDDARCAHVTVVERVPSLHAVALADGPEVMPVRVVRPAPQAVVVVSREFGAVRVANELLRPHGQQRLHVSHEDRLVDAAPKQ